MDDEIAGPLAVEGGDHRRRGSGLPANRRPPLFERPLGEGEFTIALETSTPSAWERAFEKRGATVRREPGTPPTVVATFEGERTGYLVVHDLNAEVSGGG